MQFKFKGIEFDTVGILAFAAPLFAALILMFLVSPQAKSQFSAIVSSEERFIVMPRNCYLKTP